MFSPVTLGPLGLSIATDLGICGALGLVIDRDQSIDEMTKQQIKDQLHEDGHVYPIHQFQTFMVNLLTLVRNAYHSFPKDAKDDVTPQHVYETVMMDINTLDALLQTQAPNVEKIYYINHYGDLLKRFPRAYLRTVKTDRQREEVRITEWVLNELTKGFTANKDSPFEVYKFHIHRPGFKKTLMLTHIPFDLLSYAKFNPLVLLESHTGTLKERPRWYTKFTNRHTERVPFNQMTLQILGDGNNFLGLPPKKLQDYLINLAIQKQWTYMTTKDKIIADVRSLHDPIFEKLVRDMFK